MLVPEDCIWMVVFDYGDGHASHRWTWLHSHRTLLASLLACACWEDSAAM